jgi:predicted nucleotidyltransferase
MYTLFELKVGSHLYGTSTPESDEDFAGVFIAPLKSYFGLENVKEVDQSVVSKLESGKNAPDAVDKKLYEIRNFFKLAVDNSPNILEMVIAPKDSWTLSTNTGTDIYKNAHLFPWAGCKNKFVGYAKGQMHKMTIKTGNYTDLVQAHDWLSELMYSREKAGSLLAEYRTSGSPGFQFYQSHATVGDINISLTDKMSKVYNKVVDRLSKVGNREELYTKYGYDVKFGMHCARILLEGIELMKTGTIEFPLKEAPLLKDIRAGKYRQEEIVQMCEEFTKELDTMETVLPSRPRYAEIETLLMNILQLHFAFQKGKQILS